MSTNSDSAFSLEPGDHLCLFYEEDPAEQMPALVPYIQEGLSNNEQFIYIADDQTVDELAGRLQRSGINVRTDSERGALRLWTRREWRQPGELSSETKCLQVSQFIEEALNAGFKGARFAIEMTWTLGPEISADKLEHWEATLNTIFTPNVPGRIICQYNRSRLSPETMLAALHTHPLVIFGDQVHTNFFYEAPLILGGNRNGVPSAARVDWMSLQLKRARVEENKRQEARRLAEQALRETEGRMAQLMSLMPAAVYTCDEQGRITFFNRRAVELWGREPQMNEDDKQFCGSYRLWRPDGSLLPHDETPMAIALQTGNPARNEEVTIERPDGSRITVRVNIDPLYAADGRRRGAINVFQDVTERTRAEEASLRLAAIVESSEDAIVSKDLNGIITTWNQGAERLFGYTAEEVIGQSVTILMPPERYAEEPRILERTRRGESIHYETVRRRKSGSLVDISLTVSPIKDRHGRIIGASKIARNITAQKQLQRALQESEAQFRQLADALPQIVWTARPDGFIDYYNERWYEFTGFPRAEFEEQRWEVILHPDDVERSLATYSGCIQSGNPYQIEYRFKDRRTGGYRWFLGRAIPVRDERGRIVRWFGTCTDIDETKRAEQELHQLNAELEKRVADRTADLARANAALLRDMEERRKLEDQLRQAQKMESIGTLAGGIAHDFNNILNIIAGYASLLSPHAVENEEIADSLKVIHEAVKRGAGVVEQLLTLARKTGAKLELTDANGIVRGLCDLLKQTFPKTIEVTLDVRAVLPPVMADSNQITQALLNLCVNARDAMPGGGKLTLRTGVVDAKSLPGYAEVKAEQFVFIDVTDSGMGIEESIRSRIFEPFFTTKGPGKGTGLGLAVVYGIVKNHKGIIEIYSSLGRGTTFRIFLPVLSANQRARSRAQVIDLPTDRGRGGSARRGGVLVVEDENPMRQLLEHYLASHGYRVFTAADGELALDLYRKHKEELNTVILDMGLPKISGLEVLSKIRSEEPRVTIVVASGYLDPDLREAVARQGVTRLVNKPYNPDEILAAVEEESSTGTSDFVP